MNRGVRLGLACAFAAASQPALRTAPEAPAPSVWVGADGMAWQLGEDGAVQVPAAAPVAAAARLDGDTLLVGRDGLLFRVSPGPSTAPTRVRGVPRLRSLSCGPDRCLGVTADARVAEWSAAAPPHLVDGLDDVQAVAAGGRHALALTHTGRVWSWGDDDRGQLGSGPTSGATEPALIRGLDGVVGIAAGAAHGVAVRHDGSVWAWGASESGAGERDEDRPVRIEDAPDVLQAAAAGHRSYLLGADGRVYRLGPDVAPAPVPGEMILLHPGGDAVLAERSDGSVWDCASGREVKPPRALAAAAPAPPPSSAPLAGRVAFLVGPGDLSLGDARVRDRLLGLGLDVDTVAQAEGGAFERLAEASLVVVSASVDASSLDRARLDAVTVPVVTWERFLFRPLGLAGRVGPRGPVAPAARGVSIVRPRHPLAAGFERAVDVLAGPARLAAAWPADGVDVVAVAPDGAPVILARDGRRARRVGLFLPAGSEAALTPDGGALFDAAVSWSLRAEPARAAAPTEAASGTILLVAGNVALSAGDAVYRARMEALGFTVQVKQASVALPSDATGKAMVFVSETAPNADVGTKFTNVPVPVAIQAAGIVDDMLMVAPGARGSCAAASAQANVQTSTHPIANGLAGVVGVAGSAGGQDWGTPSASGQRVLTCTGSTTQSTAFTYGPGDPMAGLAAPARRTLWGFHAPIPTTFTRTGADLFDRMVLWTTNTPNQAPEVDAGPDQGAHACEPPLGCESITLDGHVFDDGLPNATTTIAWSVVAGPGTVVFGTPAQAVTTATFDNTGVFTLRLTASDGVFTRSDDVDVDVHGFGSNLPPAVDAGPDLTAEAGGPVLLAPSVADDGLPNPPGTMTFAWSQVSGPGTAVFGDPAALVTTATFPVKGTYVLRLTANDSELTGYDDVVAVVNQSVLLVVGSPALTAGDAFLKARIESLGFPVVVRDDAAASDADAVGRVFVWLSSTVDNTVISTASPFVNVAVPVVVQSSGYVDNLGLTTGATGTSGTLAAQTGLTVGAPAHPLAAGLRNTVTVASAGSVSWGVPNGAAASVVRVVPTPVRQAVFAYGPGAAMAGGINAPERRLFFGPQDDLLPRLNANGRRLLDAAILWMARTNAAPWVDAGPPATAILAPPSVAVALPGYVTDDFLPNPPATFTTSWSQVSGPGPVTFQSPGQASTTATFTTPGTYVLRLQANDTARTASDFAFVTILAAGVNAPPTVDAGPDQTVRQTLGASLSAAAADDGRPGPLQASWSKAFGPGTVTFAPAAALATRATFSAPGVYVLRVTVGDGALSAADELQVTVETSPPALLVVAEPASADDQRMQAEMNALGLATQRKAYQDVVAADANGKAVVVISASVASGTLGALFRDTTTPVVLSESQLFDDMGMTAAPGDVAVGTQVAIARPGHPAAAGLAGLQAVYAAPANIDWGAPAPQAAVVATFAGDPSKAALFAYERGASMASGAAPARRVGLFASGAASYTPAGAALFRAAVAWAAERTASALLLVANPSALSATDALAKERIAEAGYGVTLRSGAASSSADAAGKAFVVVSNASAAAGTFRDVATAVVAWDGPVLSAMDMVGPTAGVGYGTAPGQIQVAILDQLHPLSGGLSGTITTSTDDTYTWGVPGGGVAKVGTLVGDASRATVFGYEIGAGLATNGSAVDRRVGLFPGPATGSAITPAGRSIVDAALRWAAASDPDRDGLGTGDEYRHGTDPHDADTNDDGLLDGAAVASGVSPTSTDVDGDGVPNAAERQQGSDPFRRDTDGDGATDGADCFPLDPTRSACPTPTPGDVTPPVITLLEPESAVLLP